MKNKRLFAAFLPALALFALAACSHHQTGRIPSAANAKTDSTPTPQREERLVIAYDGEDGKTALELLKALARVRTATSQMGELVEEINGVASGNGHYLIYFVNGATAKTGAAEYVTRKGDKIEWKLVGPRKQ